MKHFKLQIHTTINTKYQIGELTRSNIPNALRSDNEGARRLILYRNIRTKTNFGKSNNSRKVDSNLFYN